MEKPWILGFCLALLLPRALEAEEVVVDGIAAQVGSDIVLVSEVMGLAGPVEERMREAGAEEVEIVKLRAEILDRLIERKLVQQVVRRAELEATNAEVDAAIAGIAQENGITVEEVVTSVEAQGLSFSQYKERIRGEIEQMKVINGMVRSRVRVDEGEVRALYDQKYGEQPEGGEEVRLRHILLTFPEGAKAADRRSVCGRVSGALARIRAGESFETVAGELSEVNPELGGEVGWLHLGSVAAWMSPVKEMNRPGQVSEVIETPFGCNILQMVERREWEPIRYDEAKDALWSQLYEQRTGDEYVEFIEKLRAQTYIERKGLFADAARLTPSRTVSEQEGVPLVQ